MAVTERPTDAVLVTFRKPSMPSPPLDPDVADLAPTESVLTAYDEEHIVTYLRLLDANAEDADWREVAHIVLHIDPDQEPDRARSAFDRRQMDDERGLQPSFAQ